MDKLYIVIPAYNEQDTIEQVIREWYPIVENAGRESRLVIVNDGSKDTTFQIMQECAKNRPQFIPLTKENSGHGATVLWAYKYALEEILLSQFDKMCIFKYSKEEKTPAAKLPNQIHGNTKKARFNKIMQIQKEKRI